MQRFYIIPFYFHSQLSHHRLRIYYYLDKLSNSRTRISFIKYLTHLKRKHKTFKKLNTVCRLLNSRTLKLIITPHQSSVQRKPLQLAFETSLISAGADTSKDVTSLVTYVACRALSPYVNCHTVTAPVWLIDELIIRPYFVFLYFTFLSAQLLSNAACRDMNVNLRSIEMVVQCVFMQMFFHSR